MRFTASNAQFSDVSTYIYIFFKRFSRWLISCYRGTVIFCQRPGVQWAWIFSCNDLPLKIDNSHNVPSEIVYLVWPNCMQTVHSITVCCTCLRLAIYLYSWFWYKNLRFEVLGLVYVSGMTFCRCGNGTYIWSIWNLFTDLTKSCAYHTPRVVLGWSKHCECIPGHGCVKQGW